MPLLSTLNIPSGAPPGPSDTACAGVMWDLRGPQKHSSLRAATLGQPPPSVGGTPRHCPCPLSQLAAPQACSPAAVSPFPWPHRGLIFAPGALPQPPCLQSSLERPPPAPSPEALQAWHSGLSGSVSSLTRIPSTSARQSPRPCLSVLWPPNSVPPLCWSSDISESRSLAMTLHLLTRNDYTRQKECVYIILKIMSEQINPEITEGSL